MSLAAIVEAMERSGCSAKQIAEAVRAAEAEREEEILARREKARIKKQKQREEEKARKINNHVPVTTGDEAGQMGTIGDAPSPDIDNRADACVNHEISLTGDINLKPNPSGLSKAERKASSTRKSSLPEDAQPTDADRKLADEAGLSEAEFREEWRAFRDHHCSRGTLMKNWHLAWSTWLRNSKKFAARAGPSKGKTSGWAKMAMKEMEKEREQRSEKAEPNQALPMLSVVNLDERRADGSDDGGISRNASDVLGFKCFRSM